MCMSGMSLSLCTVVGSLAVGVMGNVAGGSSDDDGRSGGSGSSRSYKDSTTSATAVLERVLQELELIKSAKTGNVTPEGIMLLNMVWSGSVCCGGD